MKNFISFLIIAAKELFGDYNLVLVECLRSKFCLKIFSVFC